MISRFKRMLSSEQHALHTIFGENTSKASLKGYKINFSFQFVSCPVPTQIVFDFDGLINSEPKFGHILMETIKAVKLQMQ